MITNDYETPIVIDLPPEVCWILRSSLKPTVFWKDVQDGQPEAKMLMDLREQANAAILRFNDEPGLEKVRFYLNEMQAWAIDTCLPYDGDGGTCTRTLVDLFRGLWSQSMDPIFRQLADHPYEKLDKTPTEEAAINQAFDPMEIWQRLFLVPIHSVAADDTVEEETTDKPKPATDDDEEKDFFW